MRKSFRKPDSIIAVKERTKNFISCFLVLLWLFMSYRVHSSPLICKYLCLYCSFVGSGYRERDIYCIYEDKKKNSNVKEKNAVIQKAHVFLNVPTFCQNVYFFGKALTTVALLLWWQNNRKYEAQSVFCWLRQAVRKAKMSGFSLLEGCLFPSASSAGIPAPM